VERNEHSVVLSSGAKTAFLDVNTSHNMVKIDQKSRFREIFGIENGNMVELSSIFPPEELGAARTNLNSIFPEGSAERPRTLWVRMSVPSYLADLAALTGRLGCTLWVESVGKISGSFEP
jgi:hypothetical protein